MRQKSSADFTGYWQRHDKTRKPLLRVLAGGHYIALWQHLLAAA